MYGVLPLSVYDSVTYDSKVEAKNQQITRPGIKLCDWFILCLHWFYFH